MDKVPKDTSKDEVGPLVDTSKDEVGPLVEEIRITREVSSPHKEVANTETRIDPFASRPGHVLKWTNVSVKVARKGEDDIQVLQDVSGALQPRQLLCIMGHSGAGYVLHSKHCVTIV
jgi:ABC-type multidrug transport system fused ATPase/permease subunit